MGDLLVPEFLARSARKYPDKVALVCGQRRVTYAELLEDSQRFARALVEHGLEPGQRVVILLPNDIEAVVSIFGVLLAGGVFALLHPETRPRKLRYVLEDTEAHGLVTSASHLRDVELSGTCLRWIVLRDADAGGLTHAGGIPCTPFAEWVARESAAPLHGGADMDELCALIYTSGSQGRPKGVMLSHRNVQAATDSIIEYLGNEATDIVLDTLPLSFDYGLYNVLMPLRFGGTVVLEPRFLSPHRLVQHILREQVTGLPLIPTLIAILIQFRGLERCDLSSIRYITSTGQTLPPAHSARLQQLFPQAQIFSMYGLTECKRVSYLPPGQLAQRPTSVGHAIPHTRAYLVDAHGRRVTRPFVRGELVVEGKNVMLGYWRLPQESSRVLATGTAAYERVLRTGDLFEMDEEGYLYFVSRKDDLIKTGGNLVSAKDIEETLCELPGISAAAAFGVEHPILGQAVAAAVVARDGMAIDISALFAHCAHHLEPHAVPKRIDVRQELPRTGNGKTDYASLRALSIASSNAEVGA